MAINKRNSTVLKELFLREGKCLTTAALVFAQTLANVKNSRPRSLDDLL